MLAVKTLLSAAELPESAAAAAGPRPEPAIA
jgi:hypothetical protein